MSKKKVRKSSVRRFVVRSFVFSWGCGYNFYAYRPLKHYYIHYLRR